jgi:hypothetical protein
MSQRAALILFCSLLFATSFLCLFGKNQLKKIRDWLVFKIAATIVLFGGATVVLLYKILHLSLADFGEYRRLLFAAFALICGLSFFKVRDLLAMRGLAILLLFLCDSVLDSVYCSTFFLHNAFVCIVYIAIIFFIFAGAMPYILRDCLDRIIANDAVAATSGCLCFIFSIVALGAVFI